MAAAKNTNASLRDRISSILSELAALTDELEFREESSSSRVPPCFPLIQYLMTNFAKSIKKIAAEDLKVGLICADRDGNRIRVDRVQLDNQDVGSLSYHFLNDELRVQEGVQERTVEQFLSEGWVMAAAGTVL